MKFIAYDTEEEVYLDDFLITSDGEVMVPIDKCGACDQDFYSIPEYEIKLEVV